MDTSDSKDKTKTKMGSIPNIPTELLLSYPYFWRPAKISKFAVAAAKVTEDVSPTKNRRSAQAVEENWKNVLSKLKCDVNWPANVILYDEKGTEQTLESLEITHFHILTRRYNVHSGRRDARKVPLSEKDFSNPMQLLKIIRNKHQHAKDMPLEFLKELDWATSDGDFDESKFGRYWATHFPCLMPFLWVQFFPVRTKKGSVGTVSSLLKEFYPEQNETRKVQLRTQDFPIDMNGVMLCLDKALQCDLERGGITGRVKAEPTETVLEFRTLESGAIQRILDGKLILKIKFLPTDIAQCSWYSQSGAASEPADESKVEFTSSKNFENWVVIIGNIMSDVHEITASQLKSASVCKIIVLLRKYDADDFLAEAEKVEKEVDKLYKECDILIPKQQPVKWTELCEGVRDTKIKTGKFRIQNEIVSLDSLLPDCVEERAEILSCLQGNLLNQLLRDMTPQLWDGLKMREKENSGIYLNRRVEKITVISKQTIVEARNSEIFVLSNISMEKVEMIFSQKRITDADQVTIFVVKKGVACDFEQICTDIERKCLSHRNIHLVRCMHGSIFQWVETQGSTSFLEKSCANFSNDSKMFDEKDFLNGVRKCWERGQTVVIGDVPGNGKSRFLLGQAVKSRQESGKTLTVFLTMSELVDKVESCSENVSGRYLVGILSKIIGSTEFERRLCNYWLQNYTNEFRFEFFLDALDEVKMDDRPKAENILKALQDLPSVFICITLRDYLFEDIQKYIQKAEIFKLEPFSPELQADYLVQYWRSKMSEESDQETLENLQNFAFQCLSVHSSKENLRIAGTPLICSILGQVYENQALSGNYKIPVMCRPNSLVNLFDLMWNTKLDIWLGKPEISFRKKDRRSSAVLSMRDEMQNTHTYLAIKLLFSEQIANKFKFCLFPRKQSWNRLDSTVLGQGIVTSLNPVTFLHQTFAEDAVARFVVDILNGEYFAMPPNHSDFECFLSQHVLAADENNLYSFKFKYPNLCHFINLRSQNLEEKFPQDIWHSLEATVLNTSFHELGNGYREFIHSWGHTKCTNLILLLLNSPKYLFGFFVLALECRRGLDFCEYVLQNKNNVDLIFDPENWPRYAPFHLGTMFSKTHWFFQIISLSFDYNESSSTPISITDIMTSVTEKVDDILERKDEDGKSALLFLLSMPETTGCYSDIPVQSGDLGPCMLAQYLVEKFGANVNDVDDFRNSVLHVSHKQTICPSEAELHVELYVELCEVFLKNGIDKSAINNENCNGETPLFSVINVFKEKAIGALPFFKENGADFNAKDKVGTTVLCKAVMLEDQALIEALIKYGADIDGIKKSFSKEKKRKRQFFSLLSPLKCLIL